MLVVSQDGSIRLVYENLTMMTTQRMDDGLFAVAAQGGVSQVYILGFYAVKADADRQIQGIMKAFSNHEEAFSLEGDPETAGMYDEDGDDEAGDLVSMTGSGAGFLEKPVVRNVIIFVTAFILGLMASSVIL